jgi:hypothetical protein
MKTLLPTLATLAALGAVLPACDQGEGDEARSLLAAVDRFRDVESAAKPANLPAVEATKCSSAEVCSAKDACLAFARPFCVALQLTSDVEQRLNTLVTEVDAGQIDEAHQIAEKAALNGMLEQATASNQQSQKALVACDAKMQVLRAKYAR